MSPRRLFRFSLFTLLSLFSVAALALGYARWQRVRTIAAYRELHEEGVGLILATGSAPGWLRPVVDEEFWLKRPSTAEIYISASGNEFEIGGRVMTWPEAREYMLSLKARLTALGTPTIEIWSSRDGFYQELQSFSALHGMTLRYVIGLSDLQLRHQRVRPTR